MTDLSIHLRTTCPFCGEHHDRITHATKDDAAPKNGDASMCFACGAFNSASTSSACFFVSTFFQIFLIRPSGPIQNVVRATPQ